MKRIYEAVYYTDDYYDTGDTVGIFVDKETAIESLESAAKSDTHVLPDGRSFSIAELGVVYERVLDGDSFDVEDVIQKYFKAPVGSFGEVPEHAFDWHNV